MWCSRAYAVSFATGAGGRTTSLSKNWLSLSREEINIVTDFFQFLNVVPFELLGSNFSILISFVAKKTSP
ncbi:hypothetical protein SeMB42_g01146 [Synchytrium endobioticum]|uniref:Uncharacterized protein n=1 Tax=Synchytrium endobioticum TaxID=286115 RepID=A0A507DMB0_9FUNG|nr:hypothetical protein SeMB42_g01146 [Synchytrium endobioticum]